jgi:hypothetical protein
MSHDKVSPQLPFGDVVCRPAHESAAPVAPRLTSPRRTEPANNPKGKDKKMKKDSRRQIAAALRKNVPQALQQHPHWLLCAADKRPLERDGKPGSSTNPTCWCSFDDAVAAFEAGTGEGVGVVLTSGDNLVAIDMDDCVIDGDVKPCDDRFVGAIRTR